MFKTKKKINLLEQTQSNLELTQNNLEKIQDNLQTIIEKTTSKEQEKEPLEVLLTKAPDLVEEKTDDEKRKAAYALNLCTVSVSQIVEYDDIRSLDQEYDTILNNLNLQNMPKDEALLDILKQLLNVITFFKIQEGDKKMLEQEYQQKIKNAIWSAVPNMSVVVASGDPKVMLFTLATQIGIGYMNYRKGKAEAKSENEKQKWQLKRSALEQINALRRELFDTAWRLSKEYDFEDNYRLSERQIKQFNDILLDNDPARQYERLYSIKDYFEAYPPFWYYLGHAAATIKDNENAMQYFKIFLELTDVDSKNNLLREDQLRASCALELAGLIDDKKLQLDLLKKAEVASGNASDVLQICAQTYITLGEKELAARVLRYLINEGYNVDVNANVLSRIYFDLIYSGKSELRKNYNSIKNRKDAGIYMIEIPSVIPSEENKAERERIISNYFNNQKKELENNINHVYRVLDDKLFREFESICQGDGDVNREFFDFLQNTSNDVNSLFTDIYEKSYQNDPFRINLIKQLEKNKDNIKNFIENQNERKADEIKTNYDYIIKSALDVLKNKLLDRKNRCDEIDEIFELIYSLNSFCMKNDLPVYVSIDKNNNPKNDTNNSSDFEKAVYGKYYATKVKSNNILGNCKTIVNEYKEKIVVDKGRKAIISQRQATIFEITNYSTYINRNKKNITKIKEENENEFEIFAVLNDTTTNNCDLVFTTKGIIFLGNFSKYFADYDKVIHDTGDIKKDETLKIDKATFKNDNVNFNELYKMIQKLADATRE